MRFRMLRICSATISASLDSDANTGTIEIGGQIDLLLGEISLRVDQVLGLLNAWRSYPDLKNSLGHAGRGIVENLGRNAGVHKQVASDIRLLLGIFIGGAKYGDKVVSLAWLQHIREAQESTYFFKSVDFGNALDRQFGSREPLVQRGIELCCPHRLGEVSVHSGPRTALPVSAAWRGPSWR